MTPRTTFVWVLLAGIYLAIPSLAQETLYEHYVGDGIQSGLNATAEGFFLNGKPITIISGTIHFFRVHPAQWRDRLRKARAAGIIAIDTYVPWNLLEPRRDVYDFGDGGNDLSPFADVVSFIRMAQEEDLLVILRPGPYICAEYEFGGMPSWLLQDYNLQMRTSSEGFMNRVQIYFNQLMPKMAELQFIRGGPLIMFQIENEYGGFEGGKDKTYLNLLRQYMMDNGIEGVFFTSDPLGGSGDQGRLDGALMTANLRDNPDQDLDMLLEFQPDKPMMVTEYWVGWLTHWMDENSAYVEPQYVTDNLNTILSRGASVNIYTFSGATNYAFLNGAGNGGWPYYYSVTTSYEFDAVLTEAGDYTEKYYKFKDVIANHSTLGLLKPEMPPISEKAAYGTVDIVEYIPYEEIINQVNPEDHVLSEKVVPMELLNVNNGSGQSYGYILYRISVDIKNGSQLKIGGNVRDIAILLVDGVRKNSAFLTADDIGSFGYYAERDQVFTFVEENPGQKTLDIFVENWARLNGGSPDEYNYQRKGLPDGIVELDGAQLSGWEIFALEMKTPWINSLSGWLPTENFAANSPTLWRGNLHVEGVPKDTFLDMENWIKGIVFVNGFNLGRYFHLGPWYTLYVPAPVLKEGDNEIVVFEHYIPSTTVKFSAEPRIDRN